ncbi:hypothetical protein [Azorhizobium caulinodans]|uniref:hypothetical protein n=1 Tax=Azorhizobium caulinodans TaxID=7 RepID=UPI002FBE60D5
MSEASTTDQKPARDQFEEQARALAHALPPCDLGSTQAIQAVAIGLREAYRMGREAAKAPGVTSGAPYDTAHHNPNELWAIYVDETANLVVAAREAFDTGFLPRDEADALDKALAPFASKIPYENEQR